MNTIAIIVNAANKGDAISAARSTMEESLPFIGEWYDDQPEKTLSADTDAASYWATLKEHYLKHIAEIRISLRLVREATTNRTKMFRKANAYRMLDGRLYHGVSIINASYDDCNTEVNFTQRKDMASRPEDFYIVVFNYKYYRNYAYWLHKIY
jgi:hypothetical protein